MPSGGGEEEAAAFQNTTQQEVPQMPKEVAGIPVTYGVSTQPDASQAFADAPPPHYAQHNTPTAAEGNTMVHDNMHLPSQAHVPSSPLKKPAVVMYDSSKGKGQPVVQASFPDTCCNCYWGFFVLGILVFPPLFVCGSIGLASISRWERRAGLANLIALITYVVIFIVVMGV